MLIVFSITGVEQMKGLLIGGIVGAVGGAVIGFAAGVFFVVWW